MHIELVLYAKTCVSLKSLTPPKRPMTKQINKKRSLVQYLLTLEGSWPPNNAITQMKFDQLKEFKRYEQDMFL